MSSPLLAISDLSVEFRTRTGIVKALEQITFSIEEGETVGIVGESGSGKSVLSFTIMGLLEASGKITSGQIQLADQNLLSLTKKEAKRNRRDLSMIFQNPRTALNPIRSVGKQMIDVLQSNTSLSKAELRPKCLELLDQVQIPRDRFHSYPFQLSGGMCQRILIAMALARSPKLLIADEPTTGLDVVTQKAIMELIQSNAQQRNMATILITHDLGLASQYCQRIIVMHAGHVVETAPTKTLFQKAQHPYSAKLIAATPGLISQLAELEAIPGQLPDLRQAVGRPALPPCRYSLRCERYQSQCDHPLTIQTLAPNHTIACWNPLGEV